MFSLLAVSLLACPSISAKKGKDRCPKDNAFACPVPKKDSCRMIESGFGVDRCSRISLRGKNVLVIGGSRGIGRAVAQAFNREGANVISTSRHPECYLTPNNPNNPSCIGTQNGIPASPGLSNVPLELASQESIAHFFENAIKPVWDHIDILYLGGFKPALGSLAFSQANDLFEFYNWQLLGNQRVVNHAFPLMAQVDNSRILVATSVSNIFTIPFLGAYNTTKGALVEWVKQWNLERLLYEKLCGKPLYKTVAISFEASNIHSDNGNTLPVTFPGGVCCPWSLEGDPITLSYILGTFAAVPEMPAERAADAYLFMATTEDPEWRYGVFREGEKICVLPQCEPLDAEDFYSKFNAYKVKKPFTDWVEAKDWITLLRTGAPYTECVEKQDLPPFPLLPILEDTCCTETLKQSQRHTRLEFIDDLVNNDCKRSPFDDDFTLPPATCPAEG
jgi:NADP-dependent 3-hydroxy acid dehydrogenase YdfG